jgi:hypothetical protein
MPSIFHLLLPTIHKEQPNGAAMLLYSCASTRHYNFLTFDAPTCIDKACHYTSVQYLWSPLSRPVAIGTAMEPLKGSHQAGKTPGSLDYHASCQLSLKPDSNHSSFNPPW